MVSTMTFAKTLLYLLMSSVLCHGQEHIMNNDWMSLIFLFLVPSGIWVVFPFLSVMALGQKILHHLENEELTAKTLKSN